MTIAYDTYDTTPGTSSVEMTSYALLTYIARGDEDKAKPVADWLTKGRLSTGGYGSTQVSQIEEFYQINLISLILIVFSCLVHSELKL